MCFVKCVFQCTLFRGYLQVDGRKQGKNRLVFIYTLLCFTIRMAGPFYMSGIFFNQIKVTGKPKICDIFVFKLKIWCDLRQLLMFGNGNAAVNIIDYCSKNCGSLQCYKNRLSHLVR